VNEPEASVEKFDLESLLRKAVDNNDQNPGDKPMLESELFEDFNYVNTYDADRLIATLPSAHVKNLKEFLAKDNHNFFLQNKYRGIDCANVSFADAVIHGPFEYENWIMIEQRQVNKPRF
jgi:hypothetical protein